MREAVLDRLRWGGPGTGLDDGRLPAADAADLPGRAPVVADVPVRALDPQVFGVWGQGFGAFGTAGGGGNAFDLNRQIAGFAAGADVRLASGPRVGVVGGYTEADPRQRGPGGRPEPGGERDAQERLRRPVRRLRARPAGAAAGGALRRHGRAHPPGRGVRAVGHAERARRRPHGAGIRRDRLADRAGAAGGLVRRAVRGRGVCRDPARRLRGDGRRGGAGERRAGLRSRRGDRGDSGADAPGPGL